MSADLFKSLCAELVDIVTAHCNPDNSAVGYCAAVLTRAHTALAKPEPVAPTDEEIEEWADASSEVPLEEMDPDIHGWRRCFTKEEFGASIRAALARWGTPANNTGGTH